jgi:hypothetical protein
VAALFACFFVCLVRGLGVQSLVFTGSGAVLMVGLALGQWRGMKRRSERRQ